MPGSREQFLYCDRHNVPDPGKSHRATLERAPAIFQTDYRPGHPQVAFRLTIAGIAKQLDDK